MVVKAPVPYFEQIHILFISDFSLLLRYKEKKLNDVSNSLKQLLIPFFRELFNIVLVFLVGCLFVSTFAIFSAFIDKTPALHQVFLHKPRTTGVNISRVFFGSDEYLCPLTVPSLVAANYFLTVADFHPLSRRQENN